MDARNTDGIDPGTSQNITVTHSWIDNGDDNIAIKAGVTHMSVIDNHFFTGPRHVDRQRDACLGRASCWSMDSPRIILPAEYASRAT